MIHKVARKFPGLFWGSWFLLTVALLVFDSGDAVARRSPAAVFGTVDVVVVDGQGDSVIGLAGSFTQPPAMIASVEAGTNYGPAIVQIEAINSQFAFVRVFLLQPVDDPVTVRVNWVAGMAEVHGAAQNYTHP